MTRIPRLAAAAPTILAAAIVLGGDARATGATVEAWAGEPFGVGRVTLSVGGAGPVTPLEDERFTVESTDGRVLYPVIKEEPVRRILRQILDINRPRSATFYFLFRGSEPFELQAFAPTQQTMRVAPVADAGGHARLMEAWWTEYAKRWASLRRDPQFPPVVENFLAANLARRLGRELPEPESGLLAALSPKKKAWDDLLVTEAHQLTIDQQLVSGAWSGAGPLEPLPPPMPWYDLPAPDDELNSVPVEPMASHVPAECFYLRFGNFTNYLWFRDLNRKWQGDLANMVLRRAVERAASQRLEQQLSLKENALAKVLGPQVIADVAIIGMDPYLSSGAAIGILFQARVNPLLARDLVSQRQEALKNFPDAKESTVRIGDRAVSLIATPGGEVRSYYVADGDFHLVTTSARLVQRFLQAGAGDRAIGGSSGFLTIRQRLPLDRNDAIFAYIPPEFFRELSSPAIWIESQRRARSARELSIAELARLEAAAEGVAGATIDDLIAGGILPPGFSQRGDGSHLVHDARGGDSVRGHAGFFTPVGDVEIVGATAAESAAYRRFADRFRQEVGQTPPIGVGVQRVPLADGSGETMAADVVATPLDGLKLGRLPDILGEPSGERVAPVNGDVVRAEFVLQAPPLPLLGGDNELHHLFAGLRDFRTPLIVERGHVAPGAPRAELVRMYVGAWPKPGMLKLFARPQPAEGPDPIPAGADAWQAKRDDFLLISFKPDLVREVLPQLAMEPAPRPAQAWINMADLADKQLAGAVNALGYARSRDTTLAACRLMNTLANQLHVPRESCRDVAQQLMDGRFVCPLGGEYELVATPGEAPVWTSTALARQNRFLLTQAPDDFTLPALTWFKGLRGDLRLEADELTVHVDLDMAKSAVP
jgi:hypothetical protein